MSQPTRIGIAVVEFNRCYLVGTRPAEGPLSGRAEFPGGKCRKDETSVECAVRECLEETGLAVRPVDLLLRTKHEYEHGVVDLHFWLCRPVEVEPVTSDHCGFVWIPAQQLPSCPFPDGNRAVIPRLLNRSET